MPLIEADTFTDWVPDAPGILEFTTRTFEGPYKINWHHELVADYLDAWVAGIYPRMLITMPNQYGKSTLASRHLPPYLGGRFKGAKIIHGGYTVEIMQDLIKDQIRIFEHPEYKRIFPHVELYDVKKSLPHWRTTGREAMYFGRGIGGGVNSKTANFLILEDPYKDFLEANSPVTRATVQNWYDSVFDTRGTPDARILIIMTRAHDLDVIGEQVRQMEDLGGEEWEILNLPAFYTEESFKDKHPFDPRNPYEPLWPWKHGMRELEIKEIKNAYVFQNLYQCQPGRLGSGIIKKDWFLTTNETPENLEWSRFYRFPDTEESNYSLDKKPSTAKVTRVGDKIYIQGIRYLETDYSKLIDQITEISKAEVLPTYVQNPPEKKQYKLENISREVRKKGGSIRFKKLKNEHCDIKNWMTHAQEKNIAFVNSKGTKEFLNVCEKYTDEADVDDGLVRTLTGACGIVLRQQKSTVQLYYEKMLREQRRKAS